MTKLAKSNFIERPDSGGMGYVLGALAASEIKKAIWSVPRNSNCMTLENDAIALHRILKGKIGIQSRVTANFRSAPFMPDTGSERFQGLKDTNTEASKLQHYGVLDLIYTPGVAAVAQAVSRNKELAYDYTSKWNNVAIICDGTRVLGLGNIGPEGALPVMEGKSALFKLLGDIYAYPLCLNTTDKDEIVSFVKAAEPIFGAVNIEDIESPKVLEIVERLQKELTIPVFHDDQHGTSIITLAALLNALKVVKKQHFNHIKVVIAGAGSAGYGISKILKQAGFNQILVIDSQGIIYQERPEGMENKYKREIGFITNPKRIKGYLKDAIVGADVFIGVSGRPNILDGSMVKTMNKYPIIFALSNPEPEIHPSVALANGAKVVATGRSDFPNQINNVSVFPSMLRVLLDLRIRTLSEDLLVAVSTGIAELVTQVQLRSDYILPPIDDPRILPTVSDKLRKVVQLHVNGK